MYKTATEALCNQHKWQKCPPQKKLHHHTPSLMSPQPPVYAAFKFKFPSISDGTLMPQTKWSSETNWTRASTLSYPHVYVEFCHLRTREAEGGGGEGHQITDQKGCQNAEMFPWLSFNEAHQIWMKTEEQLAGVAGVGPSGDSRAEQGGVSALQTVSFPKVSDVKLIMRNPIFRVRDAGFFNFQHRAAWPGEFLCCPSIM